MWSSSQNKIPSCTSKFSNIWSRRSFLPSTGSKVGERLNEFPLSVLIHWNLSRIPRQQASYAFFFSWKLSSSLAQFNLRRTFISAAVLGSIQTLFWAQRSLVSLCWTLMKALHRHWTETISWTRSSPRVQTTNWEASIKASTALGIWRSDSLTDVPSGSGIISSKVPTSQGSGCLPFLLGNIPFLLPFTLRLSVHRPSIWRLSFVPVYAAVEFLLVP